MTAPAYRSISFRIVPDVIAEKAVAATVDAALAAKAAAADFDSLAARVSAEEVATADATAARAVLATQIAAAEVDIATKASAAALGAVDARVSAEETASASVAAALADRPTNADVNSALLTRAAQADFAALSASSGAAIAALNQMGAVLCGPEGALAVAQVPGSAAVYEFSAGVEQTLA